MLVNRTVGTVLPIQEWLLLTHQLPPKPAYFRVKIWRRLQALGAVGIKNAVYALPANEQSYEDFEWLLKEIVEGGGEGMICEARLVGGLSDGEVREVFRTARDADYDELAKEVRALAGPLVNPASDEQRGPGQPQLRRLKARRDQIVSIDFFGANGREAVDGLLSELEARLREPEPVPESAPGTPAEANCSMLTNVRDATWVTREGVHVDRIASAWLIRHFIDTEAKFKFVKPKGYEPEPGELRFDMFEAEFTHEGDRCTFEVLLARAGLDDPALKPIGEIVHDIDLKDGKFGREEAPGIRMLIASICSSSSTDEERIARGSSVFDDLHRFFRKGWK